MKTEILPAGMPQALERAMAILTAGGLVAFPTDTVYGLGTLAFNPHGIQALYAVKQRDNLKAIPILLSDPAELAQVTAGMSEIAQRLAQRFWPGPLTLVVSRHPALPAAISPQPTIGVRMPDHPVALALLRLTGPLATTSANLSGQDSPTTAQAVFEQLSGRIPLILDAGPTGGGAPSTVVDCTGRAPLVLRHGPITPEALLAALE